MKRILSIFIVLLALCLPATSFAICGPAPTPGGDWVFPGGFCDNILLVCPTSEYTTITEAMAAADSWDTILVAEGTYSEAVVFTQNHITLRSFGSAENTVITQPNGTTVDFGTKYGCMLDGFTVSLTAATATGDEVIFINSSSLTSYTTVQNNIISAENKAGSDFGLYGINIDDGATALLNNRITVTQTGDGAVYGIWNSAAHPFEFVNNTLLLDQDSTGAYLTVAIAHAAGAGGILYCIENQITVDSEHTGASIGHTVYAHANLNYVNENIINAVGAAGVMYGVYTGAGDTAYYNSNFINVTTTDSDGQWANFAAGTSYAHGNIVIGDGIMGTGGTIYEGTNQINGTLSINSLDVNDYTDATIDVPAQSHYGGVIVNNDADAIEFDLDPALVGMSITLVDDAGGAMSADPNGTETITYDGVTAAAGEILISSGTIGDFLTLICITAGEWMSVGHDSNGWVEATP